jgi:hypothetical protein
MLFRSGDNLEFGALEFIQRSETVTLFSAYLSLDELKRINQFKKINRIIVRWENIDICNGIADLELFNYCKENKVVLYMNPRIHLKVLWNNEDKVFLGSANVTKKGLGEYNKEINSFNYELNALVQSLSYNDIMYFNSIIEESILVNKEIYNKLKEYKEKHAIQRERLPEIPIKKEKDYFLLSTLPMSTSPNALWKFYNSTNKKEFTKLEVLCAANDLVNYSITEGKINEHMFFDILKKEFNSQPFIVKLKNAIIEKESRYMGYTELAIWIEKNTTTVPTPRRWDIVKEENNKVKILQIWVCEFDDNFEFIKKHPNGSDRLLFNPKRKNDLLSNFINNLKLGKKESGDSYAPHQILLLTALYRTYLSSQSDYLKFSESKNHFDDIWLENLTKFKSRNQDFGMPLGVFTKRSFISIELYDKGQVIKRFRKNEKELRSKIEFIKLSDEIKNLFKVVESEVQILSFIDDKFK